MRYALHCGLLAAFALLALSAAAPAAALTDATNETTYEAGVTLAFDAGADAGADAGGEAWTLRTADGAFVSEFAVENGTVRIDTGSLANGTYLLRDGNGTVRYRFSITGAEPGSDGSDGGDGTGDADEPVVPAEPATVENGTTYEVGRTLRFSVERSGAHELRLSGGRFVRELTPSNGTVRLDTAGLSTAEYRLHGPDGTVRYRFELGWGEASDCETPVTADPERTLARNDTERLSFAVSGPGFYTLCGPGGMVGATSSPETGGFKTERLEPGAYRLQDRAGEPVAWVEITAGESDDAPSLGPIRTLENGTAYRVGDRLRLAANDSDSLELRTGNGAFVAEIAVESGNATVDTRGLDAGTYRLVADGKRVAAFRLVAPNAPVSVAEDPRQLWAGQRATVATNASGTHTLWNGSGAPVAALAPVNETVRVPTANRSGGYTLTAPNGTAVARFAVVAQELDARVVDGAVVVASNRANYPLRVTVEGANASDLFPSVENGTVRANASERLALNTTGLDAGTYQVRFAPADAEGSATVGVLGKASAGRNDTGREVETLPANATNESESGSDPETAPADNATGVRETTVSPGTPGFGVGAALAVGALAVLSAARRAERRA